MSANLQIAVVGATSQLGVALLEKLAELLPPSARVAAIDADELDGETVEYGHRELDVQAVSEFDFGHAGAAFFAESNEAFAAARQAARDAGVLVFEAGATASLAGPVLDDGAIALPQDIALPLARALAALGSANLKAVTVTACLSASRFGKPAIEELAEQTTALFTQREAETEHFPKRQAFNLLPLIGAAGEGGDSDVERALAVALPALLGQAALPVFASVVHVPMFFGVAWAVSVEFDGDAPPIAELNDAFLKAGLWLNAEPGKGETTVSPMDVVGTDLLAVDRIRIQRNRLMFWLTADAARVTAKNWCEQFAKAMQTGYFA
ncbi:Asd/ArgC dimerization domain-containing protein [Crenobacter cavernae]|uniref:Aspartate-semialdehyde dehydrogenase n=1 Tax=Crenobacter cavernae TaxID=2290923 RepID=A0A345Y7E7_9NEIS|nr:Asd/ArgC dimerization domain-containing protein [Crenobacter cavernae]AXK39849.1 aspartate-semialdehyde dehydrogenase [Crenobacter cavernae]